MFTVEPLVITDEERDELERRARAHTATQREARRARVILLCSEGVPLRQIDELVGIDQHQVGLWRRRFLERRRHRYRLRSARRGAQRRQPRR